MECDANIKLPGLNCGICGFQDCKEFQEFLKDNPGEIKRCIHLKAGQNKYDSCQSQKLHFCNKKCNLVDEFMDTQKTWKDSLGRDFDFILDTYPQESGPREVIIPHNPIRTRELDIKEGDILIGRPLGLSCGCPITHCGHVIEVDQITGVIKWCVTGPLNPRNSEHKDIGYYSAQAYEGVVKDSKVELKIGVRYWFMPHRCMLQWRHSGLINFLNKVDNNWYVRIEGLFIG